MTPAQLQAIAVHLKVNIEQIEYAREQFTFKGGSVLLVRVFGKPPRFVSKKVLPTMDLNEQITRAKLAFLAGEAIERYELQSEEVHPFLPPKEIYVVKTVSGKEMQFSNADFLSAVNEEIKSLEHSRLGKALNNQFESSQGYYH